MKAGVDFRKHIDLSEESVENRRLRWDFFFNIQTVVYILLYFLVLAQIQVRNHPCFLNIIILKIKLMK
jgi:hypothetical protein